MAGNRHTSREPKASNVPSSSMAEESAYHVTLPAVCDITQVETLYQTVSAQGLHKQVDVQADAVERMTTPVLQLLLVWRQQAQAEGKGWHLRSPSVAVQQAIEDLGLGALLLHPAPTDVNR